MRNFSKSDIKAVTMCAEGALRVINQSLSIANQSKNLETRDSRLQVVREKLDDLKKMTIQYPFLHIVGLEKFESSVHSVEAETMELRASRFANGKRLTKGRKQCCR